MNQLIVVKQVENSKLVIGKPAPLGEGVGSIMGSPPQSYAY